MAPIRGLSLPQDMAAKSTHKKHKPRAPQPPHPGKMANPLKQAQQRWQRTVRYTWDKKKG